MFETLDGQAVGGFYFYIGGHSVFIFADHSKMRKPKAFVRF